MEHAPRRSALAKTNEGRPCSSRPWCVSRRPDFALLNGTATENRDGADNEHPKLVPPYLTKHLFRKGPFWGQIEWTRQRLFVSRVMSPSLPLSSVSLHAIASSDSKTVSMDEGTKLIIVFQDAAHPIARGDRTTNNALVVAEPFL